MSVLFSSKGKTEKMRARVGERVGSVYVVLFKIALVALRPALLGLFFCVCVYIFPNCGFFF